MTKSKLEKVLEYMVNGEKELASEMLHEHIIESAREIYADLAEEDEMVEEELELDEDEDLDEDDDLEESFRDDDESGDFEDDLETMEDELETEEYFGEDDDDDLEDDEAMDDLEGEMDMDMDMEIDPEVDDDLEVEPDDAESAMANVEDAMEELKAIFADLVGADMGDEEGMDDEVADEFDDMDDLDGEDDDMEENFMEDDLDEDAKLHKQSVTMKGDDDGKKSPIPQNSSDISSGHAKAVKFAGGSDEKGGKGDSAKKMNVTGPQEQKGKFDKKIATPKNSSEKAQSLFKDKKKS